MSKPTGLVNAAEAKCVDFNTASADEIHAAMRECIGNLRRNTHAQHVTVVMPAGVYTKMLRYRFRRCRVKKGCGQYRHVLIGPARLTLRRPR